MLDRHPTAEHANRGALELLRLHVGLVIATLLCCVAPPEVVSVLVASVVPVDDVVVRVDQLDETAQGPQWRHRDASPTSTEDVLALENENGEDDEHASSELEALPVLTDLAEASIRRLPRYERHLSTNTIAIGLGRGPPLA